MRLKPVMMSNLELNWKVAPDQMGLEGAAVHIFAANLDRPTGRISAFESTLSPDELDRAGRFHFERDRIRFISGRGVLRAILASYSQIAAAQIHFNYGPRGKPALTDLPGRPTLHFNLAHADNLALIAVTRAGAVGIDVERIRPMTDAEDIAAHFFSPREVATLGTLPEGQRTEAFFNLWTRKEALLKATGDGLSETLSQIEISFAPGEPARVLRHLEPPQSSVCWTLEELSPAPEFKAAIAVAAKGPRFLCWQWPD
jgi:4'-phosphopantetheinyl transferase